jgi:DNA repair protein RecO
MPQRAQYDAIILRAYDVGEADRFLLLLTRERGLLTARARAVRKLKSRLGGHLLPYHRVSVELTEVSSGFLVTGALRRQGENMALSAFLRAEQCVEFLLSVLHEDEPLPEIFDLTALFLERSTREEEDSHIPFTLRLLSLLGILPPAHSHEHFGPLSEIERNYVDQCASGHKPMIDLSAGTQRKVLAVCETIISEQGMRKLKAKAIVAAVR